jgi:nucleoside triphosphate pyrophosphatase
MIGTMPTIMLASESPRCQQLLRTIGWIEGEHYSLVHARVPPDDSKDVRTIVAARALAERMARAKIEWLRDNPNAVSEQLQIGRSAARAILVGVATIAFCRDKVLERPLLKALELADPQDRAQARKRAVEMLRDQRGQTIHVITGLAVAVLGTRGEPATRVVVTEAKLRDYPDADIVSYVACAEPVDKAGAVGMQDQGVSLFERIHGSYPNVAGLPLRELVDLMHEQYDGVFQLPELRSGLAAKHASGASRDEGNSFPSPRIALASKSPQRRELLRQIVAPSKIQVIASRCPESYRDGESPHERVQRVALEKAEWVLAQGDFHDDIELIIGADTEVARQDSKGRWEMIGHPATPAQARRDLGRLNTGDHYVLTGLAVIGKAPGAGAGPLKRHVACEQTKVTFVDASRGLLDAYADSGEPIGRAGAYAIQGVAAMLVESVDGSYSNVVGLPLERLSQVMADEFGKPIWNFATVSNRAFPDPINGRRK